MREKLIDIVEAYADFLDWDTKYEIVDSILDAFATDNNVGGKWIPVSERLPEDGKERVLVKINDANNIIGHPAMDTDRYMGEIWVRWGHNVTHWMPLPESNTYKKNWSMR